MEMVDSCMVIIEVLIIVQSLWNGGILNVVHSLLIKNKIFQRIIMVGIQDVWLVISKLSRKEVRRIHPLYLYRIDNIV
jgi:hypothetical protein